MEKRRVSMGALPIALIGMCMNAFAEEATPPATATETKAAETKVEAKQESAIAGYDKGFFIQSSDEKYKLKVTGYIQALFDGKIIEGAADTDTINTKRARLKFSGHMFSKNVQYEIEYDFAKMAMLESMIQLVHCEAFKFRAGQFHVPFSFEQASSTATLQFVDRSAAYTYFGVPDQREPGFGFAGELADKKFEYDVGVFTGEPINGVNQNNEFRYAGRFVFNAMGNHGLDYSDTKDSQDPQVAFGVGGMFNDTPDPATIVAPATTPSAEIQKTSLTTDASVKYRGLGLHGAYFYQHNNPDFLATSNDHGFLAQVGYFVLPKTLEVAARTSQIFRGGTTKDRQEYTGGVNYYIYGGHQVKLQMDYGALIEKDGIAAGNKRLDHQVRAQLQVKI
jgi:phosphate-selective porin OprO and OprP